MDSAKFSLLDRKIQEAKGLISKLHADNSNVKRQLEEAKAEYQATMRELEQRPPDTDELKSVKAEFAKLKNERSQLKQKIRNVLRKIEGIRLEEAKGQGSLFDSE